MTDNNHTDIDSLRRHVDVSKRLGKTLGTVPHPAREHDATVEPTISVEDLLLDKLDELEAARKLLRWAPIFWYTNEQLGVALVQAKRGGASRGNWPQRFRAALERVEPTLVPWVRALDPSTPTRFGVPTVEDDDEPLDIETIKALEEADADRAAGRMISGDEIRAKYGLCDLDRARSVLAVCGTVDVLALLDELAESRAANTWYRYGDAHPTDRAQVIVRRFEDRSADPSTRGIYFAEGAGQWALDGVYETTEVPHAEDRWRYFPDGPATGA